MKTITTLQQEATEEILAAKTQGKSAMGYGHTLLNKSWRSLYSIRKRYFKAVAKLGVSEDQAAIQWQDVKDYAALCAVCDE